MKKGRQQKLSKSLARQDLGKMSQMISEKTKNENRRHIHER